MAGPGDFLGGPYVTTFKAKSPRPRGLDKDPDEKIRRDRSSHDLVLVQGGGNYRVYWKGKPIRESWDHHPRIWELLWQLGAKAKTGGTVSWDELSRGSQRAIVNRRSRLKKMLPESLDAFIKAGEDHGSYKLTVTRRQISLIELGPSDWLIPDD